MVSSVFTWHATLEPCTWCCCDTCLCWETKEVFCNCHRVSEGLRICDQQQFPNTLKGRRMHQEAALSFLLWVFSFSETVRLFVLPSNLRLGNKAAKMHILQAIIIKRTRDHEQTLMDHFLLLELPGLFQPVILWSYGLHNCNQEHWRPQKKRDS